MFGWLGFRKRKIDEIKGKLSRDEILSKGRILLVDDEKPDLIEDLQRARLTVDYVSDISTSNLEVLDRHTYSLVVLDFGGVGAGLGNEEGLSILRHIKRVYPATIVLAYTSKALTTEQSDFFRLADGVLLKDAGIAESLEKIEDALERSLDIKNLWKGMLHAAGIEPESSEDLELQDLFVRGLSDPSKLKVIGTKFAGFIKSEPAKKGASIAFEKLCEVALKSAIGV